MADVKTLFIRTGFMGLLVGGFLIAAPYFKINLSGGAAIPGYILVGYGVALAFVANTLADAMMHSGRAFILALILWISVFVLFFWIKPWGPIPFIG